MDIYSPSNNQRFRPLINMFMILLAIMSLLFIFLTIAGYGTLRLDLPSNATVRINGHEVTARLLKMRPADYQITIVSPTTSPYHNTVSVGLFRTTAYHPSLQPRDPNAIVSSLIGGVSQSGSIHIGLVKWFDDGAWFAGLVSPGATDLAVHYDAAQQQWRVGFYGSGGYPTDLTALPADVAAYIQQLEVQHAQG